MCGLREPAAGGDDLACLDPQPGLSEADYRGCRWIEGKPTPLRPGMFCCAPTLLGGSWCAKHRKIVWAYRRAHWGRVRDALANGCAQTAILSH
jgi:hypothetical protein